MKLAICSIVLNESEFLRKSYEQHSAWPGRVAHVYVHGACATYGKANPSMVTSSGFSRDDTAYLIAEFARHDGFVTSINHGWAMHQDSAQEKCELRNIYMRELDRIKPDFFVVQDADEFYTRRDQERVSEILSANIDCAECDAFMFRQRHVWWPPSVQHDVNRFRFEAVGGYAGVPHCRVYRWYPGLRYSANHNEPSLGNRSLHDAMVPMMREYEPGSGYESDPVCMHMGFARRAAEREATNRYYVARGEGHEPEGQFNRSHYVEWRGAWSAWHVGGDLPQGGRVVPWSGDVPEVWR